MQLEEIIIVTFFPFLEEVFPFNIINSTNFFSNLLALVSSTNWLLFEILKLALSSLSQLAIGQDFEVDFAVHFQYTYLF